MSLSLWTDLESHFESRQNLQAADYIQKLGVRPKEYEDMGRSAKTMSELHLRNKKQDAVNKAIGYALAAGVCFLMAERVALAAPQLDWLRQNASGAKEEISYLEQLIGKQLSPPPRGKAKAPHIFGDLSDEELHKLMTISEIRETSSDEVLFKEGEPSHSFFIILEGTVLITNDKGLHRHFESGEFFGELGLLGKQNRTATAKTEQRAKLLEFGEKSLFHAFQELPGLEQKVIRFYEMRTFLNAVQQNLFFQGFEPDELEEFFKALKTGSSKAGTRLIQQDDSSKFLLFILKGTLSVQKEGEQVSVLKAGQFVGEIGLVKQCSRTATVVSLEPVQYLYCDQQAYHQLCKRLPKFRTIIHEIAEVRSA